MFVVSQLTMVRDAWDTSALLEGNWITDLVSNTLNYLIFVTLGCIPKIGFLDYVEVGKKMGCGFAQGPEQVEMNSFR